MTSIDYAKIAEKSADDLMSDVIRLRESLEEAKAAASLAANHSAAIGAELETTLHALKGHMAEGTYREWNRVLILRTCHERTGFQFFDRDAS